MKIDDLLTLFLILLLSSWIASAFVIFFFNLDFWRSSNERTAIILIGIVLGCIGVVAFGLDDLLSFLGGDSDEDGTYIPWGVQIGGFIGFALGLYLFWITESRRELQRKNLLLKEEIHELVKENKLLEKIIKTDN